MTERTQRRDGGESDGAIREGIARREYLRTLGAGTASGVFGLGVGSATLPTSAQSAAATVSGSGDLTGDIRAAIEGLTPGRTSKEWVVVEGSGTISGQIDLPSYTGLDVQGRLTVEGQVTPFYADRVESIAIRNLTLDGSPYMGMRLRRSTDVELDGITMNLDAGIGIRIDDGWNDGTPETTRNVQIGTVEITGAGSHAVETFGVDGFEAETVRTEDSGGCGLLLNATENATVGHVDATRADPGGGYAGFRCANDAGPNVTVDRVDAVGCGRGVFTVSGSQGITINEVHLEDNGGNLIQDSRNVTIAGGTITGTGGDGVRIDSRSSQDHPHTRNVRIEGCAIEDAGGYGVRETGPETEQNAVVGNAFCNNAAGAVSTYASSTTVSENSYDCSGTPTETTPEPTPADPPELTTVQLNGTYRFENENSGQALSVADGATAEGASVVQRPYAGAPDQHWTVEHLGNGVHRIENVNSGHSLDVFEIQIGDGANVVQWPWNGGDQQRFLLGEAADGSLVAVAQHSNRVLDVEGASTESGANVLQYTYHGGDNQQWTATPVDDGPPALDGFENAPTDPDGDGAFEDLTGNGQIDNQDVVAYFQNMGDDGYLAQHRQYYDYSGNDDIDYQDLIALFGDL